MKYEDLIIIRNNYNKALKFLGELNYEFININDRLHENIIEVQLNKNDFKNLYNEIRLSPYKRKKLKIIKGIKPLFVDRNKATFFYELTDITFIFKRNHPKRELIITDPINQHKIEQGILNM